MKKLFLFLSIFASLCFFSCSFAEDESEYLSAPTVATEKTVISHTRRSSSDTAVYVYRINTTPSVEDHNSYHIGTLYPQNTEKEILDFADTLAYIGQKYKYQLVFINSDGTKYPTEWTSEVTITDGLIKTNTEHIKYEIPNTTYIAYKADDSTLKIGGDSIDILGTGNSDPFEHQSEYIPTLILKTDSRSVSFELSDDQFSGTDNIPLIAILPDDFFDTKIECIGLVGKYIKTNDEGNKIIYINWTEPASIKTVYAEDTSIALKNFIVKSPAETGMGTDY